MLPLYDSCGSHCKYSEWFLEERVLKSIIIMWLVIIKRLDGIETKESGIVIGIGLTHVCIHGHASFVPLLPHFFILELDKYMYIKFVPYYRQREYKTDMGELISHFQQKYGICLQSDDNWMSSSAIKSWSSTFGAIISSVMFFKLWLHKPDRGNP